jgi:hypothetical protein
MPHGPKIRAKAQTEDIVPQRKKRTMTKDKRMLKN